MKRFRKTSGARYRKERNETNDCAVIALSILGRMSYGDAHKYCKEAGRKVGGRMFTSDLMQAIHDAGLVATFVKHLRQPNGSKYTPKTIGARLTKGYYLCVSHGHFFSVVHGDVEDWTKGTRTHIKTAYQITRPRK